jgi:hypothetical protein
MRDTEIRNALENVLLLRHSGDPKTRIRHEFGVCQGTRRVDVAVINGHLDGWEIKSDNDTLRRLEGQAQVYSQVLDRAWLVCTDRHLERAVEVLPDWWGVVVATGTSESVRLRRVRRPRMSPALDAMSTAQLLWRDEAMRVLRARDLAHGLSGKARWYVWERLVESMTLTDLRRTVRDALRARPAWPGGQRHQ